ncbi:hypothetical protein QYE76_001341 [Lolium multiflorum]|uniref:NAC domain-containing protein n=1 Tax=Lolium multiflorum TaxID=4521 RepID=A0AAD8RNK7_LOLMU|nr:hypothetical protein QYE76_001341 [Lolium multiflorum]
MLPAVLKSYFGASQPIEDDIWLNQIRRVMATRNLLLCAVAMEWPWESSLELENLVSTPIDAGLPFHCPSPDLPPFQPSHMNIDQLQSQHGDLLFSAVAMESESSFELDNLVSTPIDAGFPFHSPSPDLPPVQPSHMNIDQLQSQQGDLRPSIAAMELEVEPSLDVDAEFPLPSLSEPPPVQPSHRNIGDQLKSAAAQSREPLEPSSNPTDLELVENLRPVLRAAWQSLGESLSVCRLGLRNVVVNAGLPLLNPSELPGIKAGEKYFYLTDNHQVSRHFVGDLQIPNGFWRQNSLGSPVIDNSFRDLRIVGFKKTYKFFIWKDPLQCTKGVETNWTMDVYSVMTKAYREIHPILAIPHHRFHTRFKLSRREAAMADLSPDARSIYDLLHGEIEGLLEQKLSGFAESIVKSVNTKFEAATANLDTRLDARLDDLRDELSFSNVGGLHSGAARADPPPPPTLPAAAPSSSAAAASSSTQGARAGMNSGPDGLGVDTSSRGKGYDLYVPPPARGMRPDPAATTVARTIVPPSSFDTADVFGSGPRVEFPSTLLLNSRGLLLVGLKLPVVISLVLPGRNSVSMLCRAILSEEPMPIPAQSAMNETLAPVLRKCAIVFFDDILIYSRTLDDHVQHLRLVLQILQNDQWQVKLSKCAFAQERIAYLGHIISAEGVATDDTKIAAISKWSVPTTAKEIRSFLGITGYYRKFIRHYGVISKPLTNLLRKGTLFVWTAIEEEAFQTLKQALISAPVLALPDFNKEFVIETDASDKGLGAVLMQAGHPLAYPVWLRDIADSYKHDDKAQEILQKLAVAPKGELGSYTLFQGLIKAKAERVPYPGLLQPLKVPQGVWQTVTMDFIEGLPQSGSHNSILVFVDAFTKFLSKFCRSGWFRVDMTLSLKSRVTRTPPSLALLQMRRLGGTLVCRRGLPTANPSAAAARLLRGSGGRPHLRRGWGKLAVDMPQRRGTLFQL